MAVTVAAVATRYRDWNFDCIGYSAAAWHWLGAREVELHGRVYGELTSVAPREALDALVAGSSYRRAVSTQASALLAQVPFYENKPVYVGLIAQAARWGVNTHVAAFIISAISGGLLMSLFLAEVSRVSNAYVAAVLAALVGLSLPFRAVVTQATPDALFAMLAFGCVTLVLRRGNGYVVALLAIACALTRPDGVPFVLALLAFRAVESKKRLPSAMTALAAIGAACLALARGYAWKVLIFHTFVRRVVERSDADSARFAVSDYARIVQEGLSGRFTPDLTVAPLVAGSTIVVVLVSRKEPHPRRRSLLLFLLLSWATIVIHFLVFPMLADRFFIASYLTCIALCLELLRHRYATRPLRHSCP
ncbi:MAG TPA: hypothetical protein VI072_22550 [Polyangiaceae bacterium]